MIRLRSYLQDRWLDGDGPVETLVDPSTEAPLAETATGGLDLAAALAHARTVGGPALRALSLAGRAALLGRMSRALHAHRDELLDLSRANNGATRGDAKFDVDGATGTLAWYARAGEKLGDAPFLVDGEAERLSRGARLVGRHLRLPRPGVAVHVNAFNFPAWGTFEKIAQAFLAGMPVLTKPATPTALVAFRAVEIVLAEADLPPGTLAFLAGPPGDLLAHLGPQDVLAFTGSAATAARLRTAPAFVEGNTRLNVEADSLNALVLAPDAAPGSDAFERALRHALTDITQKAGQKCTAIRRIAVPRPHLDAALDRLVAGLEAVRVGNPADPSVTMGPVATARQLRSVRDGIGLLAEEARVVLGGPEPVAGIGAPEGRGFFVRPTLLLAREDGAARVHDTEVFGPVATVVPYDGTPEAAAAFVARGGGSLVGTLASGDRDWLARAVPAAAPWTGRLVLVDDKVADQSLPPGMVLPHQVHGGPGRAGDGEELGGLRGLALYTRRVAVQGNAAAIRALAGD